MTPGVLESEILRRAGFVHGFPTRGVDPAELGRVLGIDPEGVAQVHQVHGARVLRADGKPLGALRGEQADAVVVARGAAAVRVADCVPVLVGDVDTGEAAAVHAGWRGVVAGVVAAALGELGGRRKVAAIGPCIGPCCFEVGGDVAERIAGACDEPGVVVRRQGAKAWVDLRRAVRAQLRAGGLADADIDEATALCTKCDASRFHSFRRDGERSGRMTAVIVARGADR